MSTSPRCIRHLTNAREAAARAGDGDLELEAWLAERPPLHLFGRSRESLDISNAVWAAASERRKPIWKHLSWWMTDRTSWSAFGDVDSGVAAFRRLLDKNGLGLHRPQLLGDLALALADSGDAEAARTIVSGAVRAATTEWTHTVSGYYLAEIEWASGRPARSLRIVEHQLSDGLPESLEPIVRTTRLWCLYELDRPESDPLIPADSPALFAGAHHENTAFAALALRKSRRGRGAHSPRGPGLAREHHAQRATCALGGRPNRGDPGQPRSRPRNSDRDRTPCITTRPRLDPLPNQVVASRPRARRPATLSSDRGVRKTAGDPEARRARSLLAPDRCRARDLAENRRDPHPDRDGQVRSDDPYPGGDTRRRCARHRPEPGPLATDAALLHLLATGKTVTDAAATLGISRRTATRRLERSAAC